MPRRWLDRIILVLLAGLAILMLSEAWMGLHEASEPFIESNATRWLVGLVAGLGIGIVAALLGVAGGELLIPTIMTPLQALSSLFLYAFTRSMENF